MEFTAAKHFGIFLGHKDDSLSAVAANDQKQHPVANEKFSISEENYRETCMRVISNLTSCRLEELFL